MVIDPCKLPSYSNTANLSYNRSLFLFKDYNEFQVKRDKQISPYNGYIAFYSCKTFFCMEYQQYELWGSGHYIYGRCRTVNSVFFLYKSN